MVFTHWLTPVIAEPFCDPWEGRTDPNTLTHSGEDSIPRYQRSSQK